MRSLIQDLHYGLRQLRRNLGFAAIAIVTIALGIGVTTAMFSVVNSVLLRPLPFRQPDRLLALGGYDTRAEALSATREDVRAMVLRRGTVLSLAGTAIGIIAALGLARVIESLLYEIPPRDPMTYVGVCVVLILVSLASSYAPAARATKLDPMVALRYE